MRSPWAMRSIVKVARSGATASSVVGTASTTRLPRIPARRGMRRSRRATPGPATAIPMMLALTATPIAAGETP